MAAFMNSSKETSLTFQQKVLCGEMVAVERDRLLLNLREKKTKRNMKKKNNFEGEKTKEK